MGYVGYFNEPIVQISIPPNTSTPPYTSDFPHCSIFAWVDGLENYSQVTFTIFAYQNGIMLDKNYVYTANVQDGSAGSGTAEFELLEEYTEGTIRFWVDIAGYQGGNRVHDEHNFSFPYSKTTPGDEPILPTQFAYKKVGNEWVKGTLYQKVNGEWVETTEAFKL